MALHSIQQFILIQLGENESLRYSDMRPPTMEASQFMYHMKALMSRGFVQKGQAGKYSLTSAGKLYMDKTDKGSFRQIEQPLIGALIVCRHPQKGFLRVRRNHQPALGYIGFPIVDLPIGFTMPLLDYASDAFFDMTGKSVKLMHRADGYINTVHKGELHGSLLVHVLSAETDDAAKPISKLKYDFIWDAEMTPADKMLILKSNPFILQKLDENKEFFFFEQTIDLNIDQHS